MSERYIRLLLYLAIIGGSIIAFVSGNYTIGLILFLIYYFLFGFVAISFIMNMFGDTKKAKILMIITVPYLLYKVEKAYYYWLKASFTYAEKNDYNLALAIAKKVKETNLSTDNDRSLFNSFLACVYCDMKDNANAGLFLKKAREIPHKAVADQHYNDLEQKIKENIG